MADKLPLEDCNDCLHVGVCKFIDTLNNIKDEGLLPLDFDTTSCVAYLSQEVVDMGESEEEDVLEPKTASVMYYINTAISKMKQQNSSFSVSVIEMSTDTSRSLCKELDKDYITTVDTVIGNVPIRINEGIQEGLVHILFRE